MIDSRFNQRYTLRLSATTARILSTLLMLLFTTYSLRAQHQEAGPIESEHGVAAEDMRGEQEQLQRMTNPLLPDWRPFDVLHYDVTLDLRNAPSKELTSGICTTTITWRIGGDVAYIFNLRDLEIDSVFYNGVRVTYSDRYSPNDLIYHHQILPPQLPEAGDTDRVTIYYHGTMTDELGPGTWGGVSSSSNILYALGVGFSNNYVSTTQHWFPCYDHPNDKATFTGTFIVPAGMRAASNGLLAAIDTLENDLVSFRWEHHFPAATYLLTFAVARYVEMNVGTAELPMLLYALPGDTAKTRQSFQLLPQMVSTFAERFVRYPFEKVGYVNTPQGAMEHQTMISFPTSLARTGNPLNLVGAHELAHQWFGDLVSPVDFRHAWLNESFATFCESLWLEEVEGATGYLANQSGKITSYLNSIAPAEGKLPLYNFSRTPPSSNYPATIYDKGAIVVGMLRYELGDSLFFAAMRSWLTDYAYTSASTEQMLETLEQVSGKDLDWFFEQWVYRAGWPQLQIEYYFDGQGVQMNVKQVQEGEPYFNLPLNVAVVTDTGIENHMIRISQLQETFTVATGSTPLGVTFNDGPEVRALMQISALADVNLDQVGTDEEFVRIEPNRVRNDEQIRIDFTGNQKPLRTVYYSLFDTVGRIVQQGTISEFPFGIPTSGIASGIYIVRIQTSERLQTEQIIIER